VLFLTIMATGEQFPLDGSNQLHEALRSIPVYKELEFDTHSTSGEHALKEVGAWGEYISNIGRQADYLEPNGLQDTDAAWQHYTQDGPGRFYRAYIVPGDPMVAGMTVTPRDKNYFSVDSAYSIDQRGITASAYHAIVVQKFFDEFGGYMHHLSTNNLTIPTAILTREHGLARAVMDFGLVHDKKFIIPMPGLAPLPKQKVTEEYVEKTREQIEENEVTGVFMHNWVQANDNGGEREVDLAEYYRRGQLVGSLAAFETFTSRGSHPKHALKDAKGKDVRFFDLGLGDIARHVLALRALARTSQKTAKLILG
jgi:hypothetical protein